MLTMQKSDLHSLSRLEAPKLQLRDLNQEKPIGFLELAFFLHFYPLSRKRWHKITE